MRNVSNKGYRENQNTHFVFNKFLSKIVPFMRWYEKKKNYTAEQSTGDDIIQCICIACWLPKSTDTHSEYVIRIDFLLQEWLHERASVLLYTYIACLVNK